MKILSSLDRQKTRSAVVAVLGVLSVASLPLMANAKADNQTRPVPPPAHKPDAVPAAIPQTVQTQPVQVTKSRVGRRMASRLSGIASWYGNVFHGQKTANGEIFDENQLTACHRTLPFGTLVKVTNLLNKESVVVRITDRGKLNPERVIDLSAAAAQKLGMLRSGIAPVQLNIVTP